MLGARGARVGLKKKWRVLVLLLSFGLAMVLVSFVQGTGPAQAQEAGDETSGDDRVGAQIVGGTAVPDGKYPFIAALLDTRRGSTAYDQFLCGATLIDPDSVLTAAHCFDEGGFARDFRVALGRTDLHQNQGVMREVTRIYLHPEYDSGTLENDVAVLKLDRPVSRRVPVAGLPKTDDNKYEKPGTTLTAAGWGRREREIYPSRMRETKLEVVSDASASENYVHYHPSLMVAAGGDGRRDTCFGDSGGPLFKKEVLFVRGHGLIPIYYQIGITSYGGGEDVCGLAGQPGTFTEVNAPSIREFIKTKMNE